MHNPISATLVLVILLALGYDFINGFHDTANSIATSVSTKVLSPRQAVLMAVTLNFTGALISDRVATTISKGIVSSSVALPQYVFIGALLASILWGLLTWRLGLPSSSTHALVGGLIGAAVAYTLTLKDIMWSGVLDKVVIPLFTSPILGFFIAFLVMSGLFKLLANVALRVVNRWFAKLQILSAALMAFAHGNNDAQKSMGIITMAPVSGGIISASVGIPWEVKCACAIAMGIGTSAGGWRIIKTIGVNMSKLQPIGGFAAETSAAAIIETASMFGIPVSTTHVISAAIMGVGAAHRLSSVRWSLAKNIVTAWFLTIPATAVLGLAFTFLIKLLA